MALLILQLGSFFIVEMIVVIIGFSSKEIRTNKKTLWAYLVKYTVWPSIITVLVGLMHWGAYSGSRYISDYEPNHFNFNGPLDQLIPVVSPFVIFYWFAYIIISLSGFILVKFGGKILVVKWFISFLALSIISFVIYITIPNDVPHPTIQQTSFFDKWLQYTYDGDTASNGLPSLHNGTIWMLFFVCIRHDKRKWKPLLGIAIAGVLISLSTLFTKEHYAIDVVVTIPLVWAITYVVNRRKLPAKIELFCITKLKL